MLIFSIAQKRSKPPLLEPTPKMLAPFGLCIFFQKPQVSMWQQPKPHFCQNNKSSSEKLGSGKQASI
jgi:hypothetical protein